MLLFIYVGHELRHHKHCRALYYIRGRRTSGLHSALFLKWTHENSIFGTLSSCLAMTLTSMEAADATNTRSLGDMNNEIKATH